MKVCTLMLACLMVLCVCLMPAAPAWAARAKAAAAAPAAEGPKPANLDDAFKALATYEFGQSREALTMIADAVRDSQTNPAERAKIVKRLSGMLSGNTSLDGKRFACRQLSIAGTAETVPVLAALLLDKDLSDMARYALERISDPAAVAAMRTAMARAAGAQKVGLINSLGDRRDAESLAAMTAVLGGADVQIAEAAAAALGKIGTPEASKALIAARSRVKPEVKATVTDSILLCADRMAASNKADEAAVIYQEMFKPTEAKHIRTAALRGIMSTGGEKAMPIITEILSGSDAEMQASALRFLREVSGPESAKTVATLLPKCPVATQALLLDDLATRGDASTLPAAAAMLKSPDANVRLAAIRAAGRMGDASTLPALVALAAGPAGAEQDEARKALDRLPAANVNEAMLQQAKQGEPAARAEVIRSLGVRHVAPAVPVVLAAAADADAAVRAAALTALDVLADEKSAPDLVAIVVKAKDDKDRQAAETALGSLCSRATNKDTCVDPILAAIGGAELPAKSALIRALGRASGAKALAAVRNFTKDASADIQDAAIRSLANWSDIGAAADLLEIAKTATKPAHQVLALRGYIRLAGLPDVPAGQKMKMFGDAMAAAKRPDEKRAVLGGLGEMKSADALKMVAASIDDTTIQAEAAAAAVKIAKALGGGSKNDVAEAMTKVVGVAKEGSNVRKDAEDLLKQAGGAPPAKAPAKKVNKAPRISVLYAPAAKKEAAKAEAPPVNLTKIKKTDLSGAEALGWRIAFQAYTFRGVTFAETMDRSAAMGVKHVEIYGGQKLKAGSEVTVGAGMSDDEIAEMKKIAAAAGVKIVNFGVTGIGGDEAAARKTFEFAKKVGLETLVTEEREDKFPMLEKLAEEYKINIALHNHPKESYYWDADHVLKAVQGFKHIGSDSDTGHWMRSGLVPLDCLKKLKGHIISLHFKDLDKMGSAAHDVPWGTGEGNAKAMLQELKSQGFKGVFSIEYESGSGQELVDNVAKCVEWFGATAAELSK